eukprot:jgi/Mesvir1/1364/Mv25326-RA.2
MTMLELSCNYGLLEVLSFLHVHISCYLQCCKRNRRQLRLTARALSKRRISAAMCRNQQQQLRLYGELSSRLSPALVQALAHMILNGMADDMLPARPRDDLIDAAIADETQGMLQAVSRRMALLVDSTLLRSCCERCLNFLRRKYLDGQTLAPDDATLKKVLPMRLFFLDPVMSTNLLMSVQEDLLSVHGLLWAADTGELSLRKHRQDILPPMPASVIPMPLGIEQLRASPRFQKSLADALLNWEALEEDKRGIEVSAAVDFGVHRCTGESAPPTADTQQEPWGGYPHYFRSVDVYCVVGDYVLLDVRALPRLSTPVPIVYHDDIGLEARMRAARQSEDKEGAPTAAAKLSAKTQYTITADLRCFLQEAGVLQQWLLLTFLPLATFLAARQEDCLRELFIIGRRVTATVAAHTASLLKCLRPDAKPFFPESLRTLFDRRPERFYFEQLPLNPPAQAPAAAFLQSGRFSAAETPVEAAQGIRVMLSSAVVKEAALAVVDLTGTARRPTKRVLQRSSKTADLPYADASLLAEMEACVCPCALQTLVKFARLLVLEEKAMDLDIKRHDLFFVPLVYTTVSGQDPNTCLWKLEVKGLPEGRPGVVVGDQVYLRHASPDPRLSGAECLATVQYVYMGGMVGSKTEPPHVLLSVPPAWLATGTGSTTPASLQIHARFVFDRSLLKNMFTAIFKAALCKAPLLPCVSPACRQVAAAPGGSHGRLPGQTRTRVPTPLDVAFHPLPESELVNTKLNREQRKVVADVLHISTHARPLPPYIIFGPPGTGKTSVMVECILQLLRGNASPPRRLLVCAPSNFAADILCSGIAAGSSVAGADKWMIRLNDPRRTNASVKSDVRRFCLHDARSDRFLVPHPDELERARVIVTTCGAAAFLWARTEGPDLGIAPPSLSFTHVFVDEAGQALLPETLIPLVAAQASTPSQGEDSSTSWPSLQAATGAHHQGPNTGNSPTAASSDAKAPAQLPPAPRIILCGDPLQLGPVVSRAARWFWELTRRWLCPMVCVACVMVGVCHGCPGI